MKLEWKKGLLILWDKYCNAQEDKDFELFRSQWKIVEILRLRKAGIGCEKEKVDELLASRHNRKTLYGMLGDSTSHKLQLLSRCERDTIGFPFCTKLQLTPDEYDKCLLWCSKNTEDVLKTFGALPKKKRYKNEFSKNQAMFKKILRCYGLKPMKCGGHKQHPIDFDVPNQGDSMAMKKQFVQLIKTKYPELYTRCWNASLASNHLFPKTFKTLYLKTGNISLRSVFVRKNQNAFRLYWGF